MDIVTIIYGLAVGVIAVIGLYKAYKNDNKLTIEEVEEVLAEVKDLLNKQDDNKDSD